MTTMKQSIGSYDRRISFQASQRHVARGKKGYKECHQLLEITYPNEEELPIAP